MSTSLQCVLHSDVARLYRRISKRLAVETTSLYCSCFITPSIDNIDYVHGIGNWRNFSPFPVRGRVAAEAIPEVEIEEGL